MDVVDLYQSIANVWINKINYSISTPMKAVCFGSTVTVNYSLMPLLKGLKIEQTTTRLKEFQELKVVKKGKELGRVKHQRVVAEDEYRTYLSWHSYPILSPILRVLHLGRNRKSKTSSLCAIPKMSPHNFVMY